MGSLNLDQEAPPKPWIETPLLLSRPLSRAAGCNVFMKLENLQPSGSFKSRGIGNLMSIAVAETSAASSSIPPPPPPSDTTTTITSNPPSNNENETEAEDSGAHFFCSSGGNAGLACATCALTLGRPATIVVPETTPALMIARLRGLGARVVQTGADWAAADAYLRDCVIARHVPRHAAVYVPPFDHPDVWAGAATLVDEVVVQMGSGSIPIPGSGSGSGSGALSSGGGLLPPPRVDAIVCNVGGGGLLNGIMEGVERHWGDITRPGSDAPRVLAVETAGADSLNASVLAGRPVSLEAITSIATSLGAKRVSDKTWEWVERAGAGGAGAGIVSTTVTDAEAVAACVRFLDDTRLLVEVACGATVAMAYNGGLRRYLGKGLSDAEWAARNVVLVVCGGSNINLETLVKYRETYGV